MDASEGWVELAGTSAFVAKPSGGVPASQTPAVLILHGVTGPTPFYHAQARQFASLGYATLVPDLYALVGSPRDGYAEEGSSIQTRTSDAEFVRAAATAWDWLLSQPSVDRRRVAVCGYCMGGRLGIHFSAATPQVRCFAGYYPTAREEPKTDLRPRLVWEAASEIRCPSIVLFGGEDDVTLAPIQDKLHAGFRQNCPALDWHAFAAGGHGFAMTGATVFDASLAELAWSLVTHFFRTYLVDLEHEQPGTG
jgi:carboxymethylenebutenolidase